MTTEQPPTDPPPPDSEMNDAFLADAARDDLPPLYHDRAFQGMIGTQFFGAFNDNIFKQLVLLFALSATVGGEGKEAVESDLQWMVLFVFALPFVLFSGFAGYLSDRYGKRGMIVLCKFAEIVVMLLGAAAFALHAGLGPQAGFVGLMVVLFLMGTQSAFFGPGKYGVLPEMFRKSDLPNANGMMVLTTFVAIILGVVLAGALSDFFTGKLWMAVLICVGIAVVGTCTSFFLRQVPPAQPKLKFDKSCLTIADDTWDMLRKDSPLVAALLVSSLFWLVAGLTQPTINAVGKFQLTTDDTASRDLMISLLLGASALGIGVGGVLAGKLSQGKTNFRLVKIGALGIVACLLVLSLPGMGENWRTTHLLGYPTVFAVIMILGVFTGMFAIPLQVFIQSRPPDEQKGRTIAVMNQMNFLGILGAALIYFVFDWILTAWELPRSIAFLFTALFMLPAALFYHPKNEPADDK
ncbi:MAG: MFS transporter [Planctomycetales bacterium]